MSRAHALIIDDDIGSSMVLVNLLEVEDVSATVINGTADFADQLDDIPDCDVIFLDLEMPDLDGYQVFDLLMADARFQQVPIVACSVHSNEIAHTRRSGLSGFIAKPLDPARFPAQLERMLSGEAVWDAR